MVQGTNNIMKKETVKFNRKLKKAKELARKQALDEVKKELIKLIPITQQVIDYSDAGLDATMHGEFKASDYIKILRMQ